MSSSYLTSLPNDCSNSTRFVSPAVASTAEKTSRTTATHALPHHPMWIPGHGKYSARTIEAMAASVKPRFSHAGDPVIFRPQS